MKRRWALALVGLGVTLAAQVAVAQAASPATSQVSAAPVADAPPAAEHAEPRYQVELIVFRPVQAIGSPEAWSTEAGVAPESPAAPVFAKADAGNDAATSAAPAPGGASLPPAVASGAGSSTVAASAQASHLSLLTPADFQLERTAQRLRSSPRYVVLAHVAWRQTASPWGHPLEIPLASLGLDVPGLQGQIALERGEFLHLAVDLQYVESNPPPGLDAPPGTVFVLDQTHRVRLKRRDYFDHPAFGVIALVTAAQTPR